mmetsp:Transcript_11329/g.16781  ORF Transcript_11329/g.16781 Transcript_11329/m.16781 type:complete len:297 (+) Transcript_11329:135-1025(+)
MIDQLFSIFVPLIEEIIRGQHAVNNNQQNEEKHIVEPTATATLKQLPTFILSTKRKRRLIEQFLTLQHIEKEEHYNNNHKNREENTKEKIEKYNETKHTTMEDIAQKQGEMTKEQYEEIFSCSLCLDEYKINDKLLKLPCYHLYHDECIRKWISNHNTCPICRYELPVDDSTHETARKKRMEKRFTVAGHRILEIGQDVEKLAEMVYQLEDCIESVPENLLGRMERDLTRAMEQTIQGGVDVEGKTRQKRRALIVFIHHLQHIVAKLQKEKQLHTKRKRRDEQEDNNERPIKKKRV